MRIHIPPATAWSAALIATIVGFGGTIALVVKALQALGASVDQTASAVTALCLGIGVGGILLSLRLRMPIVLAWSTPGAALLAASTPGMPWSVAVGVFIGAALLMCLLGLVPAMGRLAQRIPGSIAAAMLAGVLLPFCLQAFRVGTSDALLVATLVAVFMIARLRAPLYALLLVLAAGIGLTLLRGQIATLPAGSVLGTLVPTTPTPDVHAILSLGLPLFFVTLVSQNLPGLIVLRNAQYEPAAAPLITGTGLLTLLAAPFGAFGINLAAITAALCTGEEAHPDRQARWTVAVLYGALYVLLAIFSPLLVRWFLALPPEVIATLTGVALIPALLGAMGSMLADQPGRDAAMLTFLATGSGVALYGLGSAFWGLAIGALTLIARRLLRGS